MMEPVTRQEKFLASLTGESVTLPDPITRKEMFLAAATGMAVNVPDPITREEMYLSKIKPGDGSGVAIRNQNKTFTENGTYKADSGYTGLGTVTVNVPIPEVEEPVLTELTITENGEYTPPDGVDGFSKVIANIAANGGGGGSMESGELTISSGTNKIEIPVNSLKSNFLIAPKSFADMFANHNTGSSQFFYTRADGAYVGGRLNVANSDTSTALNGLSHWKSENNPSPQATFTDSLITVRAYYAPIDPNITYVWFAW